MSMHSSENIRRLLVEWREQKATQLGLTPEHEQYCARHSIILHDIYIDAIAENASHIHSVSDLKQYAFYWKWIDIYGQDLFWTIRDYLDSPKRCMSSEDFEPQEAFQYSPKRMRTVR